MNHTVITEEMVSYTLIELLCVQRHLRLQRDALTRDRAGLEGRLKAGQDGDIETACRVLDAEMDVLDGAIRKNWEVISRRMKPPAQPP